MKIMKKAMLALCLLASLPVKAMSLPEFISRNKVIGSVIGAICSCIAYKTIKIANNLPSRMRWDLEKEKIYANSLTFNNKNLQEPFLWGVATSAYQVEGDDGAEVIPYNQWQRCEGKDINISGEMCKPVPHLSGKACEHWTRYKQDIDLLKKLGFNTFRISLSWGKIEPKEGVFSEDALAHYEDVCAYMVKQGIKPVVTLHHYTHPCWFEDNGGFEKEENIKIFVNFCEKVFIRLKKYVHLWFTFNTFTGYAMCGYSQATKPPFKKDMAQAIEVFKNLLESHVQVYHRLKKIDSNSCIGIYKNIFQLDPYLVCNPFDWLYSYMGNTIANDSIYNFFKTGIFKIWIPKKVDMNYENKHAIGALDMVGLNYYSGAYVKNFKIIPRSECIPTDNPRYTIYPEGFYRALLQVSEQLTKPLEKIKKCSVPIYVTENGIAPKAGKDRDIFYKRYLYALSKAMEKGVDVRGYITWSLMDNYEWSLGYDVKYGICEVDFETQERKLKAGTTFLLDVVSKN